jgi:hypothetical protein
VINLREVKRESRRNAFQPGARRGIWVMTWTLFDADARVYRKDYSIPIFPVPASSTAFELADGSFGVFSPGKALAGGFNHGGVSALIAGNSFHHMGLDAWSEKHPDALRYAAARAMPRLARQGRRNLTDVMELAARLKPGARVLSVPHLNTGDVIVSVPCAAGVAWIVCDLIFNMTAPVTHPLARLWVRLMDEYPGLKIPRVLLPVAPRKERKRLIEWLTGELERDRPTLLLPAHGTPAAKPDLWRDLIDLARARFG